MSKRKQSYKVSARELTKRTDALLQEMLSIKKHANYVHRLVAEYITFEENDDKFKAYLKKLGEEEDAAKNEIRGSSSENKAPGKGKPKPAKTGGKTTVQPKSGGQKERAVLDTKQASK